MWFNLKHKLATFNVKSSYFSFHFKCFKNVNTEGIELFLICVWVLFIRNLDVQSSYTDCHSKCFVIMITENIQFFFSLFFRSQFVHYCYTIKENNGIWMELLVTFFLFVRWFSQFVHYCYTIKEINGIWMELLVTFFFYSSAHWF